MSTPIQVLRIAATSVLLVAAVAVVPSPVAAAPAEAHGPDRSAWQQALAAVPAAGAPGVFAAAREGRHTWSGAAGVADLSNARPTRPQMRQRVGSITKTFVATTVLQLVDEGRVGLDDPIGRWLADLLPADIGAHVTVRMLLNHTSGIGNYTNALLDSVAAVERVRTTTYPPEQLVAIGLDLPRTGLPGAAHSYSNTNYILAGLLIEQVTGKDPVVEIGERIIRPLRLKDTYFPGADAAIRGPHAGAYFWPLGVRDFSEYGMTWAWMAGELIATTDDLNTFFQALLRGRLLAPATLDEMLTTVPFIPEAPEVGGYGLGIYQMSTPCGDLWGHDGGVIGQITVSLHSRDAVRQVSYAMNISHYQLGFSEPHPIDLAMQEFILAVHCPRPVAATTRSAPPMPMPGVTALSGALGER